MNTGICVSHKKFYNFKVLSSSSDSDSKTSHLLSAKEGEHWRSPSSKEDFPISIILELDNNQKQWFNTLSIGIDTNTRESWPKSFRFEISDDMISWRVIISEKNFLVATDKEYTWHTPLTNAKYLKLLILEQHKKNNQYFTVIPFLKIGIQGIINIKASSELDRLWTKGNLIDTRPDYGWSSKASQIKESESVQFDLGAINLVNEIRLKSKNQANPCFPQDFILDYSLDGNIWQTIRQEKDFIAQGNTWYSWSFLPRNIRHIRIIINEGGKNEDDHFISQIIEFEAYAIDVHNDHSHPLEGLTPYATTINAGLVRLAKDGETTLNVAVQGNDRRLKDATITSKGIIRLADNGEVSPLAAVQANDKRLREASDTYKGIVQLAKDGDIRPNVVVQGNDKRLKEATEESLGIIKLCPHGDYTERKAVQGNDPRLKNATIQWPGIVQLATDGEDKMNVVVQGNDKRLKTANTERLGIVQMSKVG